jgi:DNA-binding response OmpR family regulator
MNQPTPIRILLVEDNPTDLMLVRELFATSPGVDFDIEQASRLAEALDLLKQKTFDVVLLDLGLPDSNGVDTFAQFHRQAPGVPILVLTGLEDEKAGLAAMQSGAQDFIGKKRIQNRLIQNSVLYAVIRAQVHQREEQERKLDDQKRELHDMDRLSTNNTTSVTARIYSGSPLHDSAPDEFKAAVAEYFDLLDVAIEQRLFNEPTDYTERLRELGQQLGFLRAGPRDVVEIHTTALRRRMETGPAEKSQAYIEEARIAGLELMGHLTGYYRSFYPAAKMKETKK